MFNSKPEMRWKEVLGAFVFDFARIEAQVFLICAAFMEIHEIEKLTFSKRVDRSLMFIKEKFGDGGWELVDELIAARKIAKFRNELVHNPVFFSIGLDPCTKELYSTAGEIWVIRSSLRTISIEEAERALKTLSSIRLAIQEQDRRLELHKVATR
jgi:hypothetical protein